MDIMSITNGYYSYGPLPVINIYYPIYGMYKYNPIEIISDN